MSQQEVTLKPKLLLSAINENLNRLFFVDARDASKQLFQVISSGTPSPFMRIDTGDAGEIFCELSLDTSLYVGNINFSKFRKGLALMMLAIKDRLDADEALNMMTSDNGEMLFNIPGILREDGQFNILVLGFKQLGPGLSSVKLMYLDPDVYAAAAQTASEKPSLS